MKNLQNTKLLINKAKDLGAKFEIINDKVTISAPEALPTNLLAELKNNKHLVLQIIMNQSSKPNSNISNKNPEKINLRSKNKIPSLKNKIVLSIKSMSKNPKQLQNQIQSVNFKTLSSSIFHRTNTFISTKSASLYNTTKIYISVKYSRNSKILFNKISQINLNFNQFKTKPIAAITFEFGISKILIYEKNQIVDYLKINLPQSYFKEGLVVESQMTSNLLEFTLNENGISSTNIKILGAVPGYQTSIQNIDLPQSGKINPNTVIPIQMKQKFGISPEISEIKWLKYNSEVNKNKWLAISSTKKSIQSWISSVDFAKNKSLKLEPKPFAITRSLKYKDAVCVYLSQDGCDVIVIRNWIPLTYQTAYWGLQFSIEKEDIYDRILDVLTNTLNEHNANYNELNFNNLIPLIFSGQIKEKHIPYINNISKNLELPIAQIESPFELPNGCKTDDFLINIGLLMSQRNFKID